MTQSGARPPSTESIEWAVRIVAPMIEARLLPVDPEGIEAGIRRYTDLFDKLLAERGASGPRPAVPIDQSVTPDYLVCLEDGKRLKLLKRYLRAHYDLTPEAYRLKWGLPADYPMAAPNYSRSRSHMAKRSGLGRRRHAPTG